MAYLLDNPLILFPVGIIYIMESFSVILQVGYFKLTHGKRLFKMSPIHHHFEKCGWSEIKVVFVFSLVTLVFCVLAWFCLEIPKI
jgi:phospho-N-acetylmuramoyl-pentapeptide-transferase